MFLSFRPIIMEIKLMSSNVVGRAMEKVLLPVRDVTGLVKNDDDLCYCRVS